MLPTTGFFKDIECPYHNSTCGRPYCHFRHKKKNAECTDDQTKTKQEAEALLEEVPTYKPTPKSQLANQQQARTHIPISYVPDVVIRTAVRPPTFRPLPSLQIQTSNNKLTTATPTYNPTPLNKLQASNAHKTSSISVTASASASTSANQSAKEKSKEASESNNETYKPEEENLSYKPTITTSQQENQQHKSYTYQPTEKKLTLSSNQDFNTSTTTSYKPQESLNLNLNYSGPTYKPTDKNLECSNKESSYNPEEHTNNLITIQGGGTRTRTQAESEEEEERPTYTPTDKEHLIKHQQQQQQEQEYDYANKKEQSKSSSKSNSKNSKNNINSSTNSSSSSSSRKSSKERFKDKEKDRDKDKDREKDRDRDKDKDKDRDREKYKDKDKDREKDKDKKREKSSRDKSSSNSSSNDSSKSSKQDRDSNKDKDRKKDSNSSSSKDKERDKDKDRDKSKSSSSKDKDKDRDRDKEISHSSRDKESNKDKDKESSRDKDKDKESSKDKDKERRRSKDRDKEKERLKRDRDKDRDRKSSSNKNKSTLTTTSKIKDRDKDRDKDKKLAKLKSESVENSEEDFSDAGNAEELIAQVGIVEEEYEEEEEEEEEEDIEAQCMRIFSEYKTEKTETFPQEEYVPQNTQHHDDDKDKIEYIPTKKQRIAHEKAEGYVPKITGSIGIGSKKMQAYLTPAQQMANRFKLIKLAQANSEQFNIINEVKNITSSTTKTQQQAFNNNSNNNLSLSLSNSTNKRIAHTPSNVVEVKRPKLSTSNKHQITATIKSINTKKQDVNLIDSILSSKEKPISMYKIGSSDEKPKIVGAKAKIAPVFNANLMQKAKERINLNFKNKALMNNAKTQLQQIQVQTVQKGSKRVAHMPDFSLSDIPDVLKSERSKLPLNVRTKFLTTLADETIKLYLSKEDAYERALNEEVKCYDKCSTISTYRNCAMLAVNRIRKELQEREASGLGPISNQDVDGIKSTNNTVDEKRRQFYENILQYVASEEDLIENGYPRESTLPGRASIKSKSDSFSKSISNNTKSSSSSNERRCCRCNKIYLVDPEGFSIYKEECIYHPLRKRTLRGERTYLCCKSSEDTGCATSHTHVSEIDDLRELEGFQKTHLPEDENDIRSLSVYALDCEMCYTTKGLELTRVTIIDSDLKTVYESLVKPINPIIDYNTRFSGITEDQMEKTSTSILQVQANILHLCNSKTILIGHSLESDMKALKIIHGTIIDTALLFPHKFGLPHKRALRTLASEYLKKIIQNDVGGHDSAEDAITCMELVKWKLKEDLKVRGLRL